MSCIRAAGLYHAKHEYWNKTTRQTRHLYGVTKVNKHAGFTLIELMITAAIIAIMAAVAYPSYTQHVVRSNRAAAASFVLGVASRQEQYNLDARQYATGATALSTLGFPTVPTEVSSNYTVAVTGDNTLSPPIYSITATPIPGGNQANRDTKCGILSIDQAGNRNISGTGTVATCW